MNKKEKEVLQSQLNNEKKTLNELKQVYKKALDDINNNIAALQGRTDTENLQSIIYQTDYQNALKQQVEGILDELNTKQFNSVSEYLTNCYEDGFVGAMYNIQAQGVPLIFPIDQKQVVKALQTESKLSKSLYETLGEDVNLLKKRVSSNISRGIAQGSSYYEISKNIAAGMVGDYSKMRGGALSRAMTIARTEGHRISATSAYDAAVKSKEAGADVVKQWDAALDGRTRPEHAQLDGQIREIDEPFVSSNGHKAMYPGGFGIAALDINCRCAGLTRARWALDEEELQILKDRAEYYGLDKTTDFDDFKKKYLKAAEAPIVQNTAFTPAKSIEEAEAYAKKFVDTRYQSKYSGNISYKGISLENANKMNRVLTEVYDSYDVPMLNNLKPMNFREVKWKSAVDDGIAAAYQWGNGGTMFMNQKLFASEKVTSAFTKKADDLLHEVLKGADTLLENSALREKQRVYLEALKKTGVQCFSQTAGIDFAEATFVHESGHLLDDKIFRKLFKKKGFDISASMAKYAGNISGYAVSTNAEYIAESFSAFWYGKTDILDPDLVKIFQGARTAAKSSIVNPATDDTISLVKAFAKGSKDFPTVLLPKQEYAHVMSEIATNLTAEQEAKSVFRKPIGEYIYTVENNGFGNYRVIGKDLIDTDKFD